MGVIPHGVAHTHLDSLAHINYDGVFLQRIQARTPDTVMKNGHRSNSIINLRTASSRAACSSICLV
jgi:hypothetical protein